MMAVLSCMWVGKGLLAAKGQEADVNGDRARKLQRELDSTRRDAEGMLQVSSRWTRG